MQDQPDKTHGAGWFWERLERYLTRQGMKQTKQRQLIVENFLAMGKHVSAEDLYEEVKGQGNNFGLATIYRTLNLLKEAGLADQKNFDDGRSVFEVLEPGSHHDHMICVDCGAVVEFENETIEKLQLQVAKSLGFDLESHRLDLYGHCQKRESGDDCPRASRDV